VQLISNLLILIVIVRAAAGTVVTVIIDDSLSKAALAVPVVVVLLLSICEDPEAIRQSAEVGTDCSSCDRAWIVRICLPFTSLHTVIAHQKETTRLLGVLQDAKMTLAPVAFTILEMDCASISDLLDVKAQAVIDEELGISALDGVLHPRDLHQLLLVQRGPTLLPPVTDEECLILILIGCILGSHLVVELGGGLVGKGARHRGTFNKSAWKEIGKQLS
jgi:hypothetical protein